MMSNLNDDIVFVRIRGSAGYFDALGRADLADRLYELIPYLKDKLEKAWKYEELSDE